jgi:hypothetical protein
MAERRKAAALTRTAVKWYILIYYEGKESMPNWLKCTVAKGMFSDEFTVVVRTRSGESVSVFVPRDCAEELGSRVKVRVSERSGHNFAVLPNDNQTVVDVDSADLVPA